jgi:Fe2+ or Zn2+ uptake regulation protein
MTGGIPRRQCSPNAGRRKNDGRDHHPANAELQLLRDELRLAGLRPTRPRLLLARLLRGGGLHFVTPERLHSEACSSGANVSLATCYNTLEILAERGLVQRVFFERPKQFYDTTPSHHAHIYFEDTGELHDLPSEWLSVAQGLLGGISANQINIVVWISRSPPA